MNTYFARFQRRRLRSSWLYKIKVAKVLRRSRRASHIRGKLGKSGQADEGNAAAMTSATSISTPFASCQVIGRSGNWGKWPTGGESL